MPICLLLLTQLSLPIAIKSGQSCLFPMPAVSQGHRAVAGACQFAHLPCPSLHRLVCMLAVFQSQRLVYISAVSQVLPIGGLGT